MKSEAIELIILGMNDLKKLKKTDNKTDVSLRTFTWIKPYQLIVWTSGTLLNELIHIQLSAALYLSV